MVLLREHASLYHLWIYTQVIYYGSYVNRTGILPFDEVVLDVNMHVISDFDSSDWS